ncbi:MAG: hypothetical protein ACJASV_001623 [Pseudorhodobacter sp.]|jgi:hypothetical protein
MQPCTDQGIKNMIRAKHIAGGRYLFLSASDRCIFPNPNLARWALIFSGAKQPKSQTEEKRWSLGHKFRRWSH